MEMKITFPGNKKVNAEYKGQTIKTDQPEKAGGEGSAPEPFSLFLASIGTCAGIFVKSFCDKRDISAENIEIVQKMNYNKEERLIDKIELEIHLPEDFPDKYKEPLVNSANLCTVKKHLAKPPEITVTPV